MLICFILGSIMTSTTAVNTMVMRALHKKLRGAIERLNITMSTSTVWMTKEWSTTPKPSPNRHPSRERMVVSR